MTAYADFLASKAQVADETGFPHVDEDKVNPLLKPHQRDAVLWAVHGGRRAIFASFGLGKTIIQLEVVRLTMASVGPAARGLIVLPLGVRQEFTRDARMLGMEPPRFVRSHVDAAEPGLYMTNYESIREGKLDPTGFDVVTLDEAAILRGFGGTKTFRELMRLYEGSAAYRFVATATPSPNDYIELLSYAAFLDVLDVGQAKTRFFKRDSEQADNLTLLPHMEHEFWMWVASWALFIEKPSDLGYSDEGYVLPDIEVVWHQVPSAVVEQKPDRDGRVALFNNAEMGVQAAAAEKRASIGPRVDKMMQIIDAAPDGEHFLIWHDQEAERHAIQAALPGAYGDHVALGEHLRDQGKLPVDFMLLQPPSWHPDVWTDVARMRTLNTVQAVKGKEQHLCPLQFDIVDRLIGRWSNEGDTILDPFGGIMTVPYCALKMGRSGIGIELNPIYWRDGVAHVKGVADDMATPTLFDLLEAEAAS